MGTRRNIEASDIAWLALARRRAPGWLDYGTIERQCRVGFETVRGRAAALREAGCEIELHPHLGVRWISGPDLLDLDRIEDALRRTVPAARLRFRFEVGSTSDEIAEAIRFGAPAGSTALAETQTRGRGRRGRAWHSPPFAGLWFSIFVGDDIPDERAPLISVLASLAAAECLKRETGVEVAIRWPNDLYAGGRKLGGLLVEREPARGGWILGMGIDCDLRGADGDPSIGGIATSLAERVGRPVDRTHLAVRLIPAVLAAARGARTGEHAHAIARWSRRSDLVNRAVRARCEAGVIEGIAEEIDPFRGLRIRAARGSVWIRDTEVVRIEIA